MIPATTTCYCLVGGLLGFLIIEKYNTLEVAKMRLDEMAAAANEIAEGSPVERMRKAPRYALTEAYIPELLDNATGITLVSIEERRTPEKK